MKISVTDLHDQSHVAQFKLHLSSEHEKHISEFFFEANSFRRIIMQEVPTWAIHSISIENNTSDCYNEILSHRLTLIPTVWNGPEDDKDTFELFCMGHKTDLITTEHLRSYKNYAKPVYNDMVICHLKQGQNIKLTAQLERGIGKDHAKWSPVNNVTYELSQQESNTCIFDMQVESSGALAPSKIVEKAIKIYNTSK